MNQYLLRSFLKETLRGLAVCLLAAIILISGCGEEEKSQEQLAVGNWTQYRNRAYILLIASPKGTWSSTVKIADVTGKIVESKGNAQGSWHIESNQMVFTVLESDIEDIWQKNSTLFFDINQLSETEMRLTDESGRPVTWKKTSGQKAAAVEAEDQIIPMGPMVVNLNKNRSSDKDRYLCMNLNLALSELMPDQEVPAIHPKAREAAIIFLSSLVFNDVKDFDRIKKQTKKLTDILNPYMQGIVKEVVVEHVIVAADMDKVEEFIIEHTITEPPPAEGEEGEGPDETAEEKK